MLPSKSCRSGVDEARRRRRRQSEDGGAGAHNSHCVTEGTSRVELVVEESAMWVATTRHDDDALTMSVSTF
jgi:hypothetical protein